MKIGTTALTNCKIGSVQVNEVRIGSTLVWSFVSFDPDAQAFITAAGITNFTQQNAINQLVLDLKAYSIWTKFKALYPFVGGTATTHKYNLKNPLDTDAAFRLVFSGGWVHSSTGALPNGTNTFADTKLIPNTTLTINSAHISFYSRTNTASGVDIGSSNTGYPAGIFMLNRYSGDLSNYINVHGAGTFNTAGFARGDGFFCLRRNNATQIINSRNSVNSTFSQNSTSKTTFPVVISAINNGGGITLYSNRECAFASIGDGITDTESSNLNTAVTNFQTSLSRNV